MNIAIKKSNNDNVLIKKSNELDNDKIYRRVLKQYQCHSRLDKENPGKSRRKQNRDQEVITFPSIFH